ncbi:MAG: CpsD/CapB family tyrosine-protein kinase [Lachnospiraceae bacterium]|jgi:capsular exopolysaccharide synthesis family protein|nr:CpsD/CapB family tyrosine-protein kinase [Lachnospiraceae bacterium]
MAKIMKVYQTKNYMLNDAFDRIVARIHMKKQKDKMSTFVVCGTQPGVGTTSVAINLAIAMAGSGWKTLLIDSDLRKVGKHKHLNETEDYGLSDYLDQKTEIEEVIYDTNHDHLSYLPSGIESNSVVRGICSVRMQQLLEQVEKEYDYVIVDVPAMSAAVDGSVVASLVDGTVMVTSQRKGYTIKAIREAKRELDRVGANVLGIIVNQVEPAEYRRSMKNYDYFKKHKYMKKKIGGRV